jgi:hypothetical protein
LYSSFNFWLKSYKKYGCYMETCVLFYTYRHHNLLNMFIGARIVKKKSVGKYEKHVLRSMHTSISLTIFKIIK